MRGNLLLHGGPILTMNPAQPEVETSEEGPEQPGVPHAYYCLA